MSDMVAVPREPIQEMVDKAMCCEGGFGWREIWSAMLAAAPTGYVPVKRELLKRGVDLLSAALKNLCDHKDELPVSYEILAELRALLSPAPKDEAK